MSIEFETFWNWAVERFGYDNVKRSGPEVCINSPFVPHYDPDDGHHLQCRPEINAYHCWKSNAKGNLYQLVMETEGCDYLDAKEILGGDQYLYKLEQKLEKYFEKKYQKKHQTSVLETKESLLSLPPDTFRITALRGRWRNEAEKYLESRCIPIDSLYYCVAGSYKGRIVIPYYGPDGQLIYFNARDITGKTDLRYRGPEKEVGVGKGDVIWAQSWPKAGEKVYITEGEFDAMSLCLAEYNGMACGGKNLSEKQATLLSPYQVTICFDLDKYGSEALNKVGAFMRSNQFARQNVGIGYVKPLPGFKDWNEMLVKLGKEIIHFYIKEHEKPLDAFWGELQKLRLNCS